MIETLTEIEAIKALKARYFRHLDTKDWHGWRSLFCDDLSVKIDGPVSSADGQTTTRSLGAAEFVAHAQSMVGDCVTVHHGHMPEIELTSQNTARGIWAMDDLIVRPDGRRYHGFGHYHETYRRGADGRWKIASLHLTRLHNEGNVSGG